MKAKFLLAVAVWAGTTTLASAADYSPASLQPVTWQTSDGVILQGVYHRPTDQHAVWILLHGLDSSKEEWLPLARHLVQQGEGVLLYDARGQGKSRQRTSGESIDFHQFQTAADWLIMADDLGSAMQWLTRQKQIPARRIAVGGASIGANVALLYASRHRDVPALLLLSPGLNYAGIESEKPFLKYSPRPLFMAASPEDRYAFESVQHLTSLRNDPALRVAVGPDGQHGVNMFHDAAFMNKVLAWMKQVH